MAILWLTQTMVGFYIKCVQMIFKTMTTQSTNNAPELFTCGAGGLYFTAGYEPIATHIAITRSMFQNIILLIPCTSSGSSLVSCPWSKTSTKKLSQHGMNCKVI